MINPSPRTVRSVATASLALAFILFAQPASAQAVPCAVGEDTKCTKPAGTYCTPSEDTGGAGGCYITTQSVVRCHCLSNPPPGQPKPKPAPPPPPAPKKPGPGLGGALGAMGLVALTWLVSRRRRAS